MSVGEGVRVGADEQLPLTCSAITPSRGTRTAQERARREPSTASATDNVGERGDRSSEGVAGTAHTHLRGRVKNARTL